MAPFVGQPSCLRLAAYLAMLMFISPSAIAVAQMKPSVPMLQSRSPVAPDQQATPTLPITLTAASRVVPVTPPPPLPLVPPPPGTLPTTAARFCAACGGEESDDGPGHPTSIMTDSPTSAPSSAIYCYPNSPAQPPLPQSSPHCQATHRPTPPDDLSNLANAGPPFGSKPRMRDRYYIPEPPHRFDVMQEDIEADVCTGIADDGRGKCSLIAASDKKGSMDRNLHQWATRAVLEDSQARDEITKESRPQACTNLSSNIRRAVQNYNYYFDGVAAGGRGGAFFPPIWHVVDEVYREAGVWHDESDWEHLWPTAFTVGDLLTVEERDAAVEWVHRSLEGVGQDKTALYVLGLPPLQLLSKDLADAWARFCGWLSACEPEIKSHLANGIDYWLELQGVDIPMNEYYLDQDLDDLDSEINDILRDDMMRNPVHLRATVEATTAVGRLMDVIWGKQSGGYIPQIVGLRMHWPLKLYDTIAAIPDMVILYNILWLAVQLGAVLTTVHAIGLYGSWIYHTIISPPTMSPPPPAAWPEATVIVARIAAKAAWILPALQRLHIRRALWAYCAFVLGWPALVMVALSRGEFEHIAAAFVMKVGASAWGWRLVGHERHNYLSGALLGALFFVRAVGLASPNPYLRLQLCQLESEGLLLARAVAGTLAALTALVAMSSGNADMTLWPASFHLTLLFMLLLLDAGAKSRWLLKTNEAFNALAGDETVRSRHSKLGSYPAALGRRLQRSRAFYNWAAARHPTEAKGSLWWLAPPHAVTAAAASWWKALSESAANPTTVPPLDNPAHTAAEAWVLELGKTDSDWLAWALRQGDWITFLYLTTLLGSVMVVRCIAQSIAGAGEFFLYPLPALHRGVWQTLLGMLSFVRWGGGIGVRRVVKAHKSLLRAVQTPMVSQRQASPLMESIAVPLKEYSDGGAAAENLPAAEKLQPQGKNTRTHRRDSGGAKREGLGLSLPHTANRPRSGTYATGGGEQLPTKKSYKRKPVKLPAAAALNAVAAAASLKASPPALPSLVTADVEKLEPLSAQSVKSISTPGMTSLPSTPPRPVSKPSAILAPHFSEVSAVSIKGVAAASQITNTVEYQPPVVRSPETNPPVAVWQTPPRALRSTCSPTDRTEALGLRKLFVPRPSSAPAANSADSSMESRSRRGKLAGSSRGRITTVTPRSSPSQSRQRRSAAAMGNTSPVSRCDSPIQVTARVPWAVPLVPAALRPPPAGRAASGVLSSPFATAACQVPNEDVVTAPPLSPASATLQAHWLAAERIVAMAISSPIPNPPQLHPVLGPSIQSSMQQREQSGARDWDAPIWPRPPLFQPQQYIPHLFSDQNAADLQNTSLGWTPWDGMSWTAAMQPHQGLAQGLAQSLSQGNVESTASPGSVPLLTMLSASESFAQESFGNSGQGFGWGLVHDDRSRSLPNPQARAYGGSSNGSPSWLQEGLLQPRENVRFPTSLHSRP